MAPLRIALPAARHFRLFWIAFIFVRPCDLTIVGSLPSARARVFNSRFTGLPLVDLGELDQDGNWYLTFCSADQALRAPIQTAFEVRVKNVRCTVDEFMVDGVVTSLPDDAPVVIAVGHQLTMRGWLIKTEGEAIRDRIAVRVDAGKQFALNYGSSRADVPATLAAAGIRGANAAVGYSGLVPTRDLAPGIHHLSLIIEGRSSRTEIIVARDIPFTVARLPHE